MANPFVAGNTAAATTNNNNLDTYTEYAWDFDKDCFIYIGGKHKIVTENKALKVWIYKTLKTERWRYRAYDNAYGIELERFIGTRTNNSVSAGEIQQYVTEALVVNPYIIKVDDIKAEIAADNLVYTISLTTIYGSLVVSNAKKVN